MRHIACQCPLGLIPHFYASRPLVLSLLELKVSMPSRAYTSFLLNDKFIMNPNGKYLVSMPSRAYTSFLRPLKSFGIGAEEAACQCPLGLIPHFYRGLRQSFPDKGEGCQCPLGLIPHFYDNPVDIALMQYFAVSMPSRAYTSFLLE